MENKNPSILDQLRKIKVDARYSAGGHYCAAKRFSKYASRLGGTATPFAAVISSSTFMALQGTSILWLRILLGGLTLISTIFLALQKFASFDEKSQSHKRSGDLYLSLYKKLRHLEAEYEDTIIDQVQLNDTLKLLMDQYEQTTSISPIIEENDYECAKKQQSEGNMAYTKEDLDN